MITEIFYKKYPLLNSLVDPHGVKLEDDPNKAEQLSNQYSSFIESKTSILPNIRQYFDSRLHDSWVRKIKYNNSEVSIQLNEFSTHCFADALSDRYDIRIPHKKRIFPVFLNFNGVKSFTASWINRNNKILPLKLDKYLPKLSVFLYEEATVIEPGQISIGFIFWTSYKGNKSYLLLQIRSEHIEILEHQRQAFIDLYSQDKLELFDAFWAEKQKGVYFDYSTAMKFINKN